MQDALGNWWGVDDRKWHLLTDELHLLDVECSSIVESLGTVTPTERGLVEWIAGSNAILAGIEHGTIGHSISYSDLTENPSDVLDDLAMTLGLRRTVSQSRFTTATIGEPKAR